MRPAHEIPMVGRDKEKTQALRALTHHSGRAGVLLAGPAGVGKTRLAEEVVAQLPSGYRLVRPNPGSAHLSLSQLVLPGLMPAAHMMPVAGAEEILRLKGAARGTTGASVILLVDDAHLLTREAAETLLILARRRAVNIVLTVSTDVECPAAVTALWKDDHLRRIEVAPLSLATSHYLASALLCDSISHHSAQRLARMSDGNPLILRELVRAASDLDMFTPSEFGWDLSDTVPLSPALRDILRRSLRTLDRAAHRALELIAVAEPVPLHLVERLTSLTALSALEERSLISIAGTPLPGCSMLPGVSPIVRVHHPLIGYLIREEMSWLRRRVHVQAWVDNFADATDLPEADRLRLVVWRLESDPAMVGENELLDAAVAAHQNQDLGLASHLARCAWDLFSSRAALVQHATMQIALGDFNMAFTLIELAGDGLDSRLLRARALLLQGRLTEAWTVVATLPEPSATLYAAMTAYFRGSFTQTLSACTSLLDNEDEALRTEAHLFCMVAMCHLGRPLDALELYGLTTGLPVGSGGAFTGFHADSQMEVQAAALAVAGDLSEASRILRREFEAATTHARIAIDARRGLALGWVLLERGRPREALTYLEFTPSYAARWKLWQQRALVYVALATAVLPDVAAADRAAAALPDLADTHFRALHCTAMAWSAIRQADRSQALELLTSTVEMHHCDGAFADVAMLIHEMARLGLADLTKPYWKIPVQGPLLKARIAYARALAESDPRLLQRSAAAFADAGAELYAAEGYAELSKLYRQASNDRSATAAALRATTLAARCEGAVTPALRILDEIQPLTSRERDIATLAAKGLTDKEIAQRLTLSSRTVSNHLYRIYRKAGVNDRRELRATWAKNT